MGHSFRARKIAQARDSDKRPLPDGDPSDAPVAGGASLTRLRTSAKPDTKRWRTAQYYGTDSDIILGRGSCAVFSPG